MNHALKTIAILVAGVGLALGAAAQTSTDKPAAPKDKAHHGCMQGDTKAECAKHEGKHHGGKHHAGKGHHAKGEGCKHDGAKADASGKHDCMAKHAQTDATKGEKKEEKK